MRESQPDVFFDPEDFASSPYLEATDEHEPPTADDIHERPTLVP